MRRKTHDEFVKEVFDAVGNDYSVLGTYKNNDTKLTLIHNVCNTAFSVNRRNFIGNGSRCPECAKEIWGKKMRKTNGQFVEEFKDLWGDQYELLEEYVTNFKKVRVRHNSDACEYHEFTATPNNLLSKKSGCPKCANNIKSNTINYKHRVFEIVGDEYKVLGEYVNSKDKVLMEHTSCGYRYTVSPYSFIGASSRCPACNQSKGEKEIFRYLKERDMPFELEYTFEDCKHISLLRFDFAVKTHDGQLLCLIEFDGEQHFNARTVKGGEKEFLMCQKRDRIKNQYCQDNKIQLIRIPYWETDISQVLDDQLIPC